PSVADKQVEEVIERIAEQGGAVYALVGERGSGKSTLLSRIQSSTDSTDLLSCDPLGMEALHAKLADVLGLSPGASFETMRDLLNKRSATNALLIDNAHHLIRPVIDGFEQIDRLLSLARSSSLTTTWVFAFDSVPWQLLQRARETRPLFDDIIHLRPWTEEAIVSLL